jgi:hypothetical protein
LNHFVCILIWVELKTCTDEEKQGGALSFVKYRLN